MIANAVAARPEEGRVEAARRANQARAVRTEHRERRAVHVAATSSVGSPTGLALPTVNEDRAGRRGVHALLAGRTTPAAAIVPAEGSPEAVPEVAVRGRVATAANVMTTSLEAFSPEADTAVDALAPEAQAADAQVKAPHPAVSVAVAARTEIGVAQIEIGVARTEIAGARAASAAQEVDLTVIDALPADSKAEDGLTATDETREVFRAAAVPTGRGATQEPSAERAAARAAKDEGQDRPGPIQEDPPAPSPGTHSAASQPAKIGVA